MPPLGPFVYYSTTDRPFVTCNYIDYKHGYGWSGILVYTSNNHLEECLRHIQFAVNAFLYMIILHLSAIRRAMMA